MYPSLDSSSNILGRTQLSFKKTLPPSQAMTTAVMELRSVIPSITSFKPHLNTHQCHMSMILNNKSTIPLKIVFFRNYPRQRPLIFVTKWIEHPIVDKNTCQILYEQKYPWHAQTQLNDLVKSIQAEFVKNVPSQKTEIEKNIERLDQFTKEIQSLKTKPIGTQPPQPPVANLQHTLKIFEYQDNLISSCQNKNELYFITAQEYNQNVSRVKVISQRFSKGKILKEMERQIDSELSKDNHGKFEDQLKKYFQSRQKYHKIKILKQKYIES